MKIIFSIFIFCIVLFIYLHIHFHLKTSDDLEIFEMEQFSKSKLEEICDLRQPVLFDCDENQKIIEFFNKEYFLQNYPSFEIKIRNVGDVDDNTEMYLPLPFYSAIKLFNQDKTSTYYSDNNMDYLQETGLIKIMKTNDATMRPYMVSNCNYDILLGSHGCSTPFKYEINYRNFFLLTSGSAIIKLAPPKSSKYLFPIKDYENFEFKTLINPWNVQAEYKDDFNKVKCLEFNMVVGKTLFIPAYWWYSIKITKDATIASFKYRTYMNNIAISPYIGMHVLQLQNVKRNLVKKIDIKELNSEEKKENDE